MRKDSETYMQWQSFDIGENSPQLILIPPNMGNAYYVKSKAAVYHYKLAYNGKYIDADEQFTINWDDETIGINWIADHPILSNRDAN